MREKKCEPKWASSLTHIVAAFDWHTMYCIVRCVLHVCTWGLFTLDYWPNGWEWEWGCHFHGNGPIHITLNYGDGWVWVCLFMWTLRCVCVCVSYVWMAFHGDSVWFTTAITSIKRAFNLMRYECLLRMRFHQKYIASIRAILSLRWIMELLTP